MMSISFLTATLIIIFELGTCASNNSRLTADGKPTCYFLHGAGQKHTGEPTIATNYEHYWGNTKETIEGTCFPVFLKADTLNNNYKSEVLVDAYCDIIKRPGKKVVFAHSMAGLVLAYGIQTVDIDCGTPEQLEDANIILLSSPLKGTEMTKYLPRFCELLSDGSDDCAMVSTEYLDDKVENPLVKRGLMELIPSIQSTVKSSKWCNGREANPVYTAMGTEEVDEGLMSTMSIYAKGFVCGNQKLEQGDFQLDLESIPRKIASFLIATINAFEEGDGLVSLDKCMPENSEKGTNVELENLEKIDSQKIIEGLENGQFRFTVPLNHGDMAGKNKSYNGGPEMMKTIADTILKPKSTWEQIKNIFGNFLSSIKE